VEREMGKWGSREVGKRETIVPGEKRSGSREVGVDKAPASSFAPARPGGGERGSSATLHGSGAIAQGRSGAATSGGTVVMGNVGGDVVSGNKTVGIDQRGAHIGTQINVSGDYVEGRSPGSAPTGAPTWNRAALRDLLTSALDDQELTGLCFDHFDPVYQIFSDGMKKSDKVQTLLDYCIRQARVQELLDLVRRRNPAQYAQFERRLKS
jgi:hypothetical protein